MRLIVTDRLTLQGGRFTVQGTTRELALEVVKDYASKGVQLIVQSEETAKHFSEALQHAARVGHILLEHGDELIVCKDGTWWHCWYYND